MSAVPQHMVALAGANRTRLERAALHGEIASLRPVAGRERLAELLLDPPSCMGKMTLMDALCWVVELGEHRSARILRRLAIGQRRLVGQLTERQRALVASHITRGPDDWEQAA